jgi:hypothetical protein
MVGTRDDDLIRRLSAAVELETTAVERLLTELGYADAVAAATDAGIGFDESHLQIAIRPARNIVVL